MLRMQWKCTKKCMYNMYTMLELLWKTRCRSARVFRVKNGCEKMRGGKIRASAKVFMHKIAIIPSSSNTVVLKINRFRIRNWTFTLFNYFTHF